MTYSTSGASSPGTSAESAGFVLLVEDDPSVAWTIKDMLASEGYQVRHVETGARARSALEDPQPDLVILDLMLPDADGLVLCADIKSRVPAPVIICSATNRKRDAVLALKLGADDFIAKPFDVDEFLTRVATVLRRARAGQVNAPAASARPEDIMSAPTVFSGPSDRGPSDRYEEPQAMNGGSAPNSSGSSSSLGPLALEHARRRVTFAGEEIQLTPTEYRLLACFLSRPDEVLSRQELAMVVWGYEDASIGRSIDVHVHRLRTKLQATQEARGIAGPTVVSVRGFGYKLLKEVGSAAAA